jgi:mRNA-degrading endonuclease YafQ of YafQ-DinJ toxin-antitoxin module
MQDLSKKCNQILVNIHMKILDVTGSNAWQLIQQAHSQPWQSPQHLAQILGESTTVQPGETLFRRSDLYRRTKTLRVDPYDKIRRKFQEFMHAKRNDPRAPFGSSDKPFVSQGKFGTQIPGLRHAHITHNISVVYRVVGNQLYLYGFFTHDDLGTGNPPNLKRQNTLAQTMSNQGFEQPVRV